MLLRTNAFRNIAVTLALALASSATAGQPGELANELSLIYRPQTASGAVAFDGLARFYGLYPVSASLCLDEHRRAPNAALVSQTAAAVTRYYNFLLGDRDRDRDLLVETTVPDPLGQPVEVEDIGFNSLLAMDMMSLAQLELELRRPYRALYWYQGSRLVEDAVVQDGFDIDATYFFPTSASGGQPVKHYHALSAAPLLFGGCVGDNHASRLIREYLLNPVDRVPESPYQVLAGPAPEWSDDATTSGRLLTTIVLLRVLESRGFTAETATFRTQAVERALNELAAMPDGAVPSAHHTHLVDMLEGGRAGALADATVSFDLFTAIVRSTNMLEDQEIVQLESALANARRWLDTSVAEFTATDANAAEIAMRTVYMAVSTAREKAADKSLFPSEAYRSTGIDPTVAMDRVLDDVTVAIQGVDNRIFAERFGGAGLHVTPTLMRDRAIAGNSVDVKWTIGVHNAPLSLKSATVVVDGQASELLGEAQSLDLVPGQPQTLTSRFTIERDRVDALEPVSLALNIVASDGATGRCHALRSVYVEHPVDVAAAFRHGRMLKSGTLPIDVVVNKKTDVPAIVQYEWYSPTGLAVAEGRSGEYTMHADQDSVTLKLNVVVPSPCRPGRFPFKLRFQANGSDLGLIASNLFKPYQWVFAGPFDASGDPMALNYPPQQGVRVLDTYPSARGDVAWTIVTDGDYNEQGEIAFRSLMNAPGVAFLHTVIEIDVDATLPVLLSCTSPAELFVNGRSVLRVGKDDGGAPGYARVELARGSNRFLIKMAGNRATRVFFNLGDENNEASYLFNNNLTEILDGYTTLVRRSQGKDDQPRDTRKMVTLRYENVTAQAVAVIGTFNGWSPEQSRMRAVSVGTWEIVLSLPPGKYSYRFLVDNREQVLDPSSPAIEPDGFGGQNSVMVVE